MRFITELGRAIDVLLHNAWVAVPRLFEAFVWIAAFLALPATAPILALLMTGDLVDLEDPDEKE